MTKIGDVFSPLNWSTMLLDRKNDQLEFRIVVGKASEKLLGQRILDRENSRIKRHGGEIAFIIADVDRFKEINDKRGHAAGDVVLKCVADALQKACRESDAVARFGGDEFLVVMPDTDIEAAGLASDRIAAAIAGAAWECPAGVFSVSLGVHAGKGSDINAIFEESDKDLYRRKEERNPNAFGEKIMSLMDDDA